MPGIIALWRGGGLRENAAMKRHTPRLETQRNRNGLEVVRVLHEAPDKGPIDLVRLGFPEAAAILNAMRWFRRVRRVPDWARIIADCGGIDGPSRTGCTGSFLPEASRLQGNLVNDVDLLACCDGATFWLVRWHGIHRGGRNRRLEVRPEAEPRIRATLRLAGAALARNFRHQTRRALPQPAPRIRHPGPPMPMVESCIHWRGQRFWRRPY